MIAWEALSLTPFPNVPSLSALLRVVLHIHVTRWAVYVFWVWLGWDIVSAHERSIRSDLLASTGSGRLQRIALLGAVLGFGWWMAGWSPPWAWTTLGVPAAGAGVAGLVLGPSQIAPRAWLARSMAWLSQRIRR